MHCYLGCATHVASPTHPIKECQIKQEGRRKDMQQQEQERREKGEQWTYLEIRVTRGNEERRAAVILIYLICLYK